MAVKVSLSKSNVLEFVPDGDDQSRDIAHYLADLVRAAKRVVEASDPATVQKSGLAGVALIRKEHDRRISLLRQEIAAHEDMAMDWGLSAEVREMHRAKARKAVQELAEIQVQ